MDRQKHWQNIYESKEQTNVSWFQPHLQKSLAMIDSANLKADVRIIDVGGGASTLVDDLLARGFKNLTVLDISANALEKTKERLGNKSDFVNWITADVTQFALPENHFDLWHDRAVFHFLTDPNDRELYLNNLRRALKPEGHFIIAAFAQDGALKCSGLDVERYSLEKMQQAIGADFELLQSFGEEHHTPFNTTQNFVYGHFQMRKSL